MKESLTIKNFLTIKEAKLEPKRFNIIIGEQASGKSLVAKLLHFFQTIVPRAFFSYIFSEPSENFSINQFIIDNFSKRFPAYIWREQIFSITYSLDDIVFIITRDKTPSINFTFSSRERKFESFIENMRSYLEKAAEHRASNEYNLMVIDNSHRTTATKEIANSQYKFIRDPIPTFIPASRSFFAQLNQNPFSFLENNFSIDPYLQTFGSIYERSKRLYENRLNGTEQDIFESLQNTMQRIIKGKYRQINNEDWIASDTHKVRLANTSSGQQEAFPMLLTLCTQVLQEENAQRTFIEEPEAHLFPAAQGLIMSILSTLYAEKQSSFFITTHSPYIITALNNFILAHDVVNQKEKMRLAEFVALNDGSGRPIAYEDVAGYTMQNGVLTSIMDDEFRMMGAGMLDDISDHFQDVFNALLLRDEEAQGEDI